MKIIRQQLNRNRMEPIIYFDTETTGVDTKTDRIVSICLIKVVNGEREIKKTLINPGIPIPKSATEVHAINDEMVKDAPTFKQISKGIYEFIKDFDICGYNSNFFDVPLLYNEFNRAGIIWDYSKIVFIDACTIFKRKEQRTLTAAVKFYLNKDHSEAHDAESDVLATIDVLQAQISNYSDIPNDRIGLARYCNYDKDFCDIGGCFTKNELGDYIFNFGKNKGKKASEDKNYLEWMNKQDFLPDAKAIINQILKP